MSNEIKCIECGKDCPEPFIFQSSDIFSQTWVRVCDLECFYGLIFDYLYSINEHKSFYRWLGDKENTTDEKARNKRTDEIAKESLKLFAKCLKEVKGMPTKPYPIVIEDGLKKPKDAPIIKFKKYNITLKSKIKWTKERIANLESKLKETKKELKRYLKEREGK